MRACCDRETSCTTFAVHSEQKTAARIPPTHPNPSPAGPRARRMGSRFGLRLHCDFPWKAISHGRGPGVLAKRVRPQYEPTNRIFYCRRSQPWSNCFREIFLAAGPAPAGGTPSSEATRRSTGDMGGTTMTAIQTIGYDPEKKKYVGTWVDSTTTYL